MLVEFKKALGVFNVPFRWLAFWEQLSNNQFRVRKENVDYTIRGGYFGRTTNEREQLQRFPGYESSEFIPKVGIPTVDVTFASNLDDLTTSGFEGHLKKLRPQAYRALAHFIQAWMQAEKDGLHAKGYEDEMFALIRRIPRISLADFQTYLFYRVQTSKEERVGFIGEGFVTNFTPIAKSMKQEIDNRIQSGMSVSDEQLTHAWLSYYDEEYTMSILDAAFACEIVTKKYVSDQLTENGIERTASTDLLDGCECQKRLE